MGLVIFLSTNIVTEVLHMGVVAYHTSRRLNLDAVAFTVEILELGDHAGQYSTYREMSGPFNLLNTGELPYLPIHGRRSQMQQQSYPKDACEDSSQCVGSVAEVIC